MHGPRLRTACLGLSFTPEQVEVALAGLGLSVERLPEEGVISRTVDLLEENNVVGWFQGRAEVGQRALGSRSILASPRDRDNLVRVNRLKGREMWRPFAPSVLEEYVGDLFEIGDLRSPLDFMLAATTVRPSVQRLIPAVVHVDGTARPQSVSRAVSPRYWRLIDEFRKRTGVPCVLNTSFNLAGSPIVNSLTDALETFMNSDLDALVVEDFLVRRRV
jgi:carbamoyltransferase